MIGGEDKMKLMKRQATLLWCYMTVRELKLQRFAKNILCTEKQKCNYTPLLFSYIDLPLVLILFPQQHFLQIG